MLTPTKDLKVPNSPFKNPQNPILGEVTSMLKLIEQTSKIKKIATRVDSSKEVY